MLIGITGYMRSGKDTLADGLAKELGLKRFSFAGPIKEAVANILSISLEELEETKDKEVSWLPQITPRVLMQTLGTEWGRDMIDRDLWVKSAMRKLGDSGGICSDVRFINEALTILDHDGIIFRVTRPGYRGATHVSEGGLPDSLVTVELTNNGTIDELVNKALKVLR